MQKQVNELSNNTAFSNDEEMSPEVPEIRSRLVNTFDLEVDPFLACEESESYVALIGSSLCATRLHAAHPAYTYPVQLALPRHRQILLLVTTAVERLPAVALLGFLGGGGSTLSRKGWITFSL